MLKNIPKLIFKLLVTLLFGFFFGHLLPMSIQSILYAISLSLKESLIFLLPFIIFSCIFSCLLSFKSDVFKFIIILLICIGFSGYISTFISFNVSKFALSGFNDIQQAQAGISGTLNPFWEFKLGVQKEG